MITDTPFSQYISNKNSMLLQIIHAGYYLNTTIYIIN